MSQELLDRIAELEAENAALVARLEVYEPPHIPAEYPKALHRTVIRADAPVVESALVVDADDEAAQRAEGFA